MLKVGSPVLNSTRNKKERVGRLLKMHANKREDIDEVYAGDIAAAVGLKNVTTGDTIWTYNRNYPREMTDFVGSPAASRTKNIAIFEDAIYYMAHAVIPLMRTRGKGGVIINVGSTAGIRPRPGLSPVFVPATPTSSLVICVSLPFVKCRTAPARAGAPPRLGDRARIEAVPEALEVRELPRALLRVLRGRSGALKLRSQDLELPGLGVDLYAELDYFISHSGPPRHRLSS